MFHSLDGRAGHYALLLLTWAALCLPNLGGPSLWDIDEGNNAEAAQEMRASGNWVVPTFNFRMREDKPALLYWLQAAAYGACGVNEFAARLPSALAALVAALATYELGRRLFGRSAALLAGLLLTGSVAVCGAAHFANPDALLHALILLTLALFWRDYRRRRGGWFVWCGVTSGLAMLAKGPIGLVLPSAVTLLFLLWQRQLGRLADRRLLGGVVAFLCVAAPWYVWVGLETKGEWLKIFFLKHHVGRTLAPMENHGGAWYHVFYYAPVLVAGFAPWSVFLGLTGWDTWRGLRDGDGDRAALRFLVSWIAVVFVFFSLVVQTKLPNYVLPLYPAAALLTARSLDRWRRGLVRPPAWTVVGGVACLGLIGVGVALGTLAASGVVEIAALRGRSWPGLEALAVVGAVPLLGAALAGWLLRRGRRQGALAAVAGAGLAFTGLVAAWGGTAVERCKAPRALAAALPADQTRREARIASLAYFQPSLVFYCRREVRQLASAQDALAFLDGPLPSYLFVPAALWEQLPARSTRRYRLLGRGHDLYDNRDVVVVTNEE
jgi:4-amino-4-deoxy-L-arabinose transferase-like glycosyltransferase